MEKALLRPAGDWPNLEEKQVVQSRKSQLH